MPFAFPRIQYYFEKKLADIASWKHEYDNAVEQSRHPYRVHPLTIDEGRLVPLYVDDSRVVPLSIEEERRNRVEEAQALLREQLNNKLASPLASEHGSVIVIPEGLESHVPEDRTYIVLKDVKNVGVVSTR